MAVATVIDVVAARKALEAAGLSWELHLHDACGAQTMELKPTEGAVRDELARAFEVVSAEFANRRLAVEMVDDEGRILRVM